MQQATLDIVPTDADLAADRNAIRMEYEATGADARILLLLNELERAEKAVNRLAQQLAELESRLTRRPTPTKKNAGPGTVPGPVLGERFVNH